MERPPLVVEEPEAPVPATLEDPFREGADEVDTKPDDAGAVPVERAVLEETRLLEPPAGELVDELEVATTRDEKAVPEEKTLLEVPL